MISYIEKLPVEKQDRYGMMCLYVAVMIWGGTFFFQKMLLTSSVPVFYLIGLRFSCIALLFFKYNPLKFSKDAWLRGMGTGSILFLAFASQNFGIITVDISVAAFLTGLTVVFTPLINHLLFRKGLTFYNMVSVVLALIGTYFFNLNADSVFELSVGSIFCIVGAVFFALHVIFTAQFLKKADPVELNIIQSITCALLGYLFALLNGEQLPQTWTPISIIGLLYLGLMGSVVCYFLQTVGQKFVKNVVKVGLVLALEPIFATMIAVPFSGEILTLYKIVGMCVIFSGVLLSEFQEVLSTKRMANKQ